MDENKLGKQVALLRDRFGYTQEDLAAKLGVSKQTISNWETGLKSPRMGAIEKMSKVFNVSKGFIIDGTDDSQERLLPVFDKLTSENKNKVIDFSINLLSQQAPKVVKLQKESPSTIAAHKVDEDHVSSQEEIDDLNAYLDEADKKYDNQHKE